MTTALWIVSVLSMGGACLCGAQSSCYREQGETLKAGTLAINAVGLLVVAIMSGIAAGVWR